MGALSHICQNYKPDVDFFSKRLLQLLISNDVGRRDLELLHIARYVVLDVESIGYSQT
jgi:hypothetical protein